MGRLVICESGRRRDAGQAGSGGDIRRSGVARILEHVLHRAPLHAGVRAPRAMGIFVTLEVSIVGRIGIDDDAGSAPLLRQVDFHSAEVHAIAGNNDLSRNTDVHLLQLLEILGAPVIDIHRVGGDVTGGRGAVEGRQNTGIILVGIVVHMLPAGAGHQNLPLSVGGLQKDFLGQIHPRPVGHDLRVEAGSLELAGHVNGSIVILLAAGDVGSGGQRLELFLSQRGIGNGQEILIDLCLFGEVVVAQDSIWKRRNLGQHGCLQDGKQKTEDKSFCQ